MRGRCKTVLASEIAWTASSKCGEDALLGCLAVTTDGEERWGVGDPTSMFRLASEAVSRLANGAPNCYVVAMNKRDNRNRSAAEQLVTVRSDAARKFKTKFGSVTISGSRPNPDIVSRNVERSTKALERVGKKLTKPGVTVRPKKDVPQYSVAEGETGVFIRRLNGRVDRGRLVKGVFQVID